jgi:hypothetical protein
MSEYQYYEFRAIDRPLREDEMDELRALSTRAEITSTSLTNTYQWGSFKGRPDVLMERYFDAFVYVANWGTHRLMLRIPKRFIDVRTALAYCDDEALTLAAKNEHVIIEFHSDEEGGEWVDGEPWMGSLIPLRDDLLRGDFRALYLGWLASFEERGWFQASELDDEESDLLEPRVPSGLAKLSGPLTALADFLRIDQDLIEAAAAGSTGEPPAEPSRDELRRWMKRLPAADKDAYLIRLVSEDGSALLRTELLQRFRAATKPKGSENASANRRTVAQLLAAREALSAERRRKAAEKSQAEQARREREKAEARAKHLDQLALREADSWPKVERLIATKRPHDYDEAVALLVDLIELAGRSGRKAEAYIRVRQLRERHRNKPSFIKRLDQIKSSS